MEPRGTPEEIERAKQDYITALTVAMEATKKLMDVLEKEEHTVQNRKEYKSAFDRYHEKRIQLLEETGQIPKRTKKPTKMRW